MMAEKGSSSEVLKQPPVDIVDDVRRYRQSPELGGGEILLSPDGLNAIRRGVDLGAILDSTVLPRPGSGERIFDRGSGSTVFSRRIGGERLAVKSFHKMSLIKGTDQLKALRVLAKIGVRAAIPLIATQGKLVSAWEDYPVAIPDSRKLAYYFGILADVLAYNLRMGGVDTRETGLGWSPEWRLNPRPTGYLQRDLASPN